MTDKALAARLREHAKPLRRSGQMTHDHIADDLDRAADLIEKMAQPEPIATVYYPRTGGNVGVSWRAIPETGAMPPEGAKLYLAPPAREPVDLHPRTADLVDRFALALKQKLSAAEKKYGYSDGWADDDWMDECRGQLLSHVEKGDPRDVAAYCAFLWHHGESTAPPARKPLSAEQIKVAFDSDSNESYADFVSGVLFAEQAHGIGGEK